jgi:hypothetical protein
MKAFPTLVAVTVLTLGTGGCLRTYISHGERSPDGRNVAVVTGHGAWQRAYVDEGRKRVDVWIGPLYRKSDKEALFSHRYRYSGADLSWRIRWTSPQAVTVDLYDYGPGVLALDGAKSGAPSNHIATLEFVVDEKTGRFIEQRP